MIRSSWIRAARLPLHTIGFAPLLLGNVAAWYDCGTLNVPRLVLSLLIGLFLHLVTAFVNDVADVRTDEANLSRTPFSGGSGVLVEGQLSSAELVRGAWLALLLVLLLSGVLVFVLHVHWAILLFVGWGILSATGYSLSPVRLSYRGGGEFLVLLTYGLGLVWAGYFVQAGPAHSILVWVLSAPIGLAVFSLIVLTQFPDLEADRKAGKRSLVILLGVKPTLRIVSLAVVLSMASVAAFLFAGAVPVRTGTLSLVAAPLALWLLYLIIRRGDGGVAFYVKLSKGALVLTLWLGLAPVAGLILDRL